MKKIMLLVLVLALIPQVVLAEDKLPEKSAFHMDGRFFGLGYMSGSWAKSHESTWARARR